MDELSTSPVVPVPATASYTDRSTGLIVFGIIEIILGLFALLFIPLALLGAVMSRKVSGGGLPAGHHFLNIATYAMAAAVFFALGIGSIRAQRWARDLNLVISWIWLIAGTLGTIMLIAVLPSSFLAGFRVAASQNPQARQLPAGIAAVVLTILIAFCAFFLIVLPLIFVVFYKRQDVAETCRRRDPKVRWTERCPLPLLALCVLFAFGAIYYFLMSFSVPVYAFFGRYLTGLPAGLILITVSALEAMTAVLVFRKNIAGWWIALLMVAFRCSATGFTIGRANILDAYSKMGMSGRQIEMLRASPLFSSGLLLWWSLLYSVPIVVYLIWVRRYFSSAEAPVAPTGPDLAA